MNEVEKMYENAEPNRDCNLYKHFTECPMKHTQCEDCENFVYPPFTAEKQLELIKWIAKNESDYGLQYYGSTWTNCCDFCWEYFDKGSEDENFEESLAGLINILWQDLTDAERTQIKEILE